MPTKKQHLKIYMSPDNVEAVRNLAEKLGFRGASELTRSLLMQACQDEGIEWDEVADPIAQWGEHNRKGWA